MIIEHKYDPIICMECGELCDIVETHNFGTSNEEVWGYCKKCKIDTFHSSIITEEKEDE